MYQNSKDLESVIKKTCKFLGQSLTQASVEILHSEATALFRFN